jgi:hypothetical protein
MELSELTKRRSEHVKSCEKNNDRSHQIIADLYSDPSRFVYEILQNADDAEASKVQFSLTSDKLEITHNGKKEFNYRDVESITTIGSSTKQDDINAIGKFGAGFKSVFAVTKTPQIHSGEYHFKIRGFIIPEQLPSINNDGKTTIILPFNHSNLSCDEAYQQINKRLGFLESESLLFLRNIKEIKWKTQNNSGHYLADKDSGKAYIISRQNDEEKHQEYLLFNRPIKIEDKNIKLSIAYSLDDEINKIVPLNDTKLFVFFSTNERTGLKFLLHAPYKTTPSRETIPFEDEQNKILTRELADLVSDSILEIKKHGYLDVNFLAMLPLNDEEEHPLYKAVYEKVKTVLSTEALLPTTIANIYTTANQALLPGVKEISRLLSIDDTKRLFDREYWLSTDITYDKTRELHDYLIDKIDIEKKEMVDFAKSITDIFIVKKSDEWMIDFYAAIIGNNALFKEKNSCQSKGVLREKPIIRLDDGTHINPDNEKDELQVYFPAEQESGFKTVKRVFIENEISKEFLIKLGLKEPDKISEIKEFIAPKYKVDELNISQKAYMQDFDKAHSIWINSEDYERSKIVDILKEVNFIGSVNHNQNFLLHKPQEVYFLKEKLQMWFEGNEEDEIYFLADCLQTDDNNYREILEKLGIYAEPYVWGKEQYGGWGKWDTDRRCYARGLRGFNPKFKIEGLEFSLKKINFKRSLYIFDLALKHINKLTGIVEESSRQGFDGGSHHERKKELSNAGKLLEKHRWLYDKKGNLINTANNEITINDLHNEYNKDHEDIGKLVKALGLKPDEIKAIEEKTGGKFVPKEEVEEYEEFKRQKHEKERKQISKEIWKPNSPPEDVAINIDNDPLETIQTVDLSGQTISEATTEKSNKDESAKTETVDKSIPTSENSKDIGLWGEKYAEQYLEREYPEDDVVWLNQSGNIGKGYDFVVKNREDKGIAYYEVKTKLDEKPALFEMTGTQWEWARKLYKKGEGNKYIILLVSSAGTDTAKIKEYKNPLTLWKEGKIYAHPVNIEL